MAYWKIEFDTKAQKQFDKLDKQSQKKVQSYLNKDILNLEYPKLFGKALRNNKKGLWRYRVDKFRIICKLEVLCARYFRPLNKELRQAY